MKAPWEVHVWKLMVGVGVLAVVLGLFIVPVARDYEYMRLQRQIRDAISRLQPTDPPLFTADWKCGHGYVESAYYHTCMVHDGIPVPELYRLRDDIRLKSEGPVGLDTLDWLLDRLAKTGPVGKWFAERSEVQMRDCSGYGPTPANR
jgi:hypothetical protein